MRYACGAFYSHPWAWNEIGFGGPAYPRGYKHLALDGREPWEVAERDAEDPVPWAERAEAAKKRHADRLSSPASSPRTGRRRRADRMNGVRRRNESAWLLPNDGYPDQPPACAATCAATTTTTRSMSSSSGAGPAARS